MEEKEGQRKGKYDLEIRDLNKRQSSLLENWDFKLNSAQSVLSDLQASVDLLESKGSLLSPEVTDFISHFHSTRTQLSIVQSELTPESFQSSLSQIEKLNHLIQITDSELSKTLKVVVNQDETYKKDMEVQHLRQKLLNSELDKVREEVRENEEIVEGIEGEIERMRRMRVLKQREVFEVRSRVVEKEEELRRESGSLDLKRRCFEEFERSNDEEVLGDVDAVCSAQKKGEGEGGERWDMSVFVIPSFLVLFLALAILV